MRRLTVWIAMALVSTAPKLRADFPTTQPYPEVAYMLQTQLNPPQEIHIAKIDLDDSDVNIRVAPAGEDPDGPGGEWQTTLLPPSTIATRENFDVVINGDFFDAKDTVDAEGKSSRYVPGAWARTLGPAVTDGKVWARPTESRPALLIHSNGEPSIGAFEGVPADARNVIAGSHILVRGARRVVESESTFSTTRHPRTAVGIAEDRTRLILVVVDGRRNGKALGMSLAELADLMLALKCDSALNLDGGGSTELLLRDPKTGALHVMNKPSDGRERAVANVLGISIRGTRRIPTTLPATQESDVERDSLRQR